MSARPLDDSRIDPDKVAAVFPPKDDESDDISRGLAHLSKTATLARLHRRIDILKASARYNVEQICSELDKIAADADSYAASAEIQLELEALQR